MDTNDRIVAAIERIAAKFNNQFQSHPRITAGGGWGQFLDGPRPHRQIGLYGTSAGFLVLALADQIGTPQSNRAATLLRTWWGQREGSERRKFSQTARLAFLILCLQGWPSEDSAQIAVEATAELLRRFHSRTGSWSDYYTSEAIQDQVSRPIATGLSVLALASLDRSDRRISAVLSGAVSYLARLLRSNSSLTFSERALIAAAIIAAGGADSAGSIHDLRRVATSAPPPLSDSFSYIFEFQYSLDGDEETNWSRDSVFIYSQVFAGLAGFAADAPRDLVLSAEEILARLLDNIEMNDGFRPSRDGRLSSVEQAWACLLLARARDALQRDESVKVLRRMSFHLRRDRRPSRLTTVVLPSAAILSTTALSSLPVENVYLNVVTSIASVLAAGFYGEQVLRRLLSRRGNGH